MTNRLTWVLAATAAASTGCGTSVAAGDSVGGPPGAVSVSQAMRLDVAEPIRVRAALVARGDAVLLCDALAESYPPQCVAGVVVTGFDPATLPPTAQRAPGVRWVDRLELVVRRDGDVLSAVTAPRVGPRP